MTTIKRYSLNELVPIIEELGYKEYATSTKRWDCNSVAEEGKSVFRYNLEDDLTNCYIFRDRIQNFEDKIKDESLTKDQIKVFKKAIELLKKINYEIGYCDVAGFKETYERDKNIHNTRFYHEFPLDKKINALYDDLSAIFLQYDGVAAPWCNKQAYVRSMKGNKRSLQEFASYAYPDNEEKQAEFLKLKNDNERCSYIEKDFGKDITDVIDACATEEERIKIVKDNVEFTHVLLGPTDSPAWGIILYGKVVKKSGDSSADQLAMDSKYADFQNLTLKDVLKIKNNDISQFLQAKLDLDRENLEVVDTKVVGDDEYRIYKAPKEMGDGRTHYLIRYVCPSTQRVYYNEIVESMLQSSKYYERNKPESFIYAWWHVNNGGEDPVEACKLGVARC